jgi:uncharacterized protein YydD (DUF2326 family)
VTGEQGAKDPFGKVGEKLRAIFEKSKAESLRLSKVARIQLDVTGLKRGRERVVRDLGERCFRLLHDGKYAIEEVRSLVDEIDALERRIALCEAQIEELRDRKEEKESAGGGAQGPSPDQP